MSYDRLSIGSTGYYMSVSTYDLSGTAPVCMCNLHDPSGTIIDRVSISHTDFAGTIGLNVMHYPGAEDKPYFQRDPE